MGSEIGWEGEIAKNMRKILGMMNMFTIWIIVTVVWVYIYVYMSKLIRVYILKVFTVSYENYTSMKLMQKTHYFKDKIYVELRV